MVEQALERGHEVTLFNRGKTNAHLFPEVEKLVGDRDGGLDRLKGRNWDTAIDVNGYLPRLVSDSARILSDSVGRYVYISTLSVFARYDIPDQDEDAPLATLEDPSIEEITGESYGALKALCEIAAEETLPERVFTIRPGYVVGPHDHTDRFTYWPWRISSGGEVLGPGAEDNPLQIIDARDLAAFTIHGVENLFTSTYNCVGPEYDLSWGVFLSACKTVSGSDVEFTWVSEEFLTEQDITEAGLPMWPVAEVQGVMRVNNRKAIADGLTFRPLQETIRDTLVWSKDRAKPKVGLTPEREAELLQLWRNQN
jgi:2'-hydroxyisoflavone reductase